MNETAINPQDALVSTLTELVAQLKRPAIPADEELWTCEDVAAWLKLSPDTVERRVVTRPDFPIALQPCQTGKRAARRWFAAEVKQWARQRRSTLPTPRKRADQSRRPATSEAVAL